MLAAQTRVLIRFLSSTQHVSKGGAAPIRSPEKEFWAHDLPIAL